MKKNSVKNLTSSLLFLFFTTLSFSIYGQQGPPNQPKSDFWNHVHYGGGFSVSLGSGYTDIMLAPSAIYTYNRFFSFGTGLHFSYVTQKNYSDSGVYGVNLITLFNPIPQAQLSLELEQSYISTTYDTVGYPRYTDSFWNTGLFVGAGYNANNVVFGARYNVLFNKDRSPYSDAWMPFVRVYF